MVAALAAFACATAQAEPQGKLKEFVDFLLSADGQKMVESLEFIRVN
jgi:hypothetical protein